MTTDLAERLSVPWLMFLAEWSLRWGILIALLAAGFRLWPPRSAATRHRLCLLVLATGLFLPLAPRWGNLPIPWFGPPSKSAASVIEPTTSPLPRIKAEPTTQARVPQDAPALAHQVVPAKVAPIPKKEAAAASTALGFRGWAAVAASALWGSVVLVLLVRWIGGLLFVAGLRRGAMEVDGSARRLLNDCRTALNVRRRVSLATHSKVSSPVTLGGRHPLILVPEGWGEWPAASRRASLLHELAHVANLDDWSKLVQELARIPLFFHPLVAWLLGRLDLERELLCDEAAVALGSDPVPYARLLVDLARRPGRLSPGGSSLRPGWLPFLDRRTLASRIERLLEDDAASTMAVPRRRPSIALGAVAIALGLGLGGLGIRAVALEPALPATKESPKSEPAAAQALPAPARILQGQLLNLNNEPIADADVVAGINFAGFPNHQAFRTDREGRFAYPVPQGDQSLYVIAHKAGLSPTIWSDWVPAEAPKEVVLKLGPASSFSGKLMDADGNPLQGAKIQMEMRAICRAYPRNKDNPAAGNTVETFYEDLPADILTDSPLQGIIESQTDANGDFTFPEVPGKRWFQLRVTDPTRGEMRVREETSSEEVVAASMTEVGFVEGNPKGRARLVAIPAARVVGRVMTRVPGANVSGLEIQYQGSNPTKSHVPNKNVKGRPVRTDAEGRFVIDGLYDGTINIFVKGPGLGEAWTYRAARDVTLTSGVTSEVTIDLIPPVAVEGKVVNKDTGEPVAGVVIGIHGPARPRSSTSISSTATDKQGLFHIKLPPGETIFHAQGSGHAEEEALKEGSAQIVTIPEDAREFKDITLKVPKLAPQE